MARYVSNISEVIMDAIDLEALISEYVTLKRAGTNVKGLCPFHNEKSPSFVVSKEKQFYHCFGCGASGNAIGFVMAIENLDFLDTLEFLADKAHLDLEQYKEQGPAGQKPQIPQNKDEKKKFFEISGHAARFFYMNLKKHEAPRKYFENRGITEETIKKFGLGFAEDEWRSLLDYLDKPPYTAEELEKVGLVISKDKSKGYYDRFRDRVMFPIIDVQGKVVAFGGRIMGDGQPKYLNSPETPIFNKSNTLYNLNLAKNELNNERTLIVVEGYMDVIALYQSGIKNVVATLGTALTTQHGRLLKRYADEIIIAYDSDEAGQKATRRSVDILEQADLTVRVLLLTDGLDPDDYVKKYGVETLRTKLKKAMSYLDYQIKLLRDAHNLDFEDDRRRFYDAVVVLLKPMKESALKAKYVEELARWTHMDLDAIKKEVLKVEKQTQTYQKPAYQKKLNKVRMIETRLMYLSLLSKENFDKLFKLVKFEYIQDPVIKKVMNFLKGYYQVMEEFKLEDCIDHLGIDEIKYIQLVIEKSIEPENIEREIQMNSKNFEIEVVDMKMIKVINRRMLIKESDELSDLERDTQLKKLDVILVGLQDEQKKLKALGR